MINYEQIVINCMKECLKPIVLQSAQSAECVGDVFCIDYFQRQAEIHYKSDLIEPAMFYLNCLGEVAELQNKAKSDKTRGAIDIVKPILKNVLNYLIDTGDTSGTPQKLQITIPDNILNQLEKKGLVTKEPLKWNKTLSLLAYFVEVANDKLRLKHGEKRTIQPFETMFNIKGITGAINDYKKTGTLPIGYEIIDDVFK